MKSFPDIDDRKETASIWFQSLQGKMILAAQRLEENYDGPVDAEAPAAPGRFVVTPWEREEGGGGRMGLLRGRVFEKIGAHLSVVEGTFTPELASQIPGAEEDPHFWAAGLSVIAHPWNPHAPTAHMNTRFVVTSKFWFGGGADLTPMLDKRRAADDPDTVAFHAAMRGACERNPPVGDYPKFKAQCDDYFFLPHRNEPRGVGGIFFDHLSSSDDIGDRAWEDDFAFVRDVGESFVSAYEAILERNIATPWTQAERQEQLARRSRYVEFNLLYDRGTIFGLKTGGNIEAILSSLPPTVKWP